MKPQPADDAAIETLLAELVARPRPLALRGVVQPYAWGGFDFIPALIGRPPDASRPAAELWLGAHPSAPASVVTDRGEASLAAVLERGAPAVLGDALAARFHGSLPYLLKVLDVRGMLSIQAHPTIAQAASGFARENDRGVPIDAPSRSYRDRSHKPEMQVALTEFWMLSGFRPADDLIRTIERAPELRPLVPELADPPGGSSTGGVGSRIRALYERVMTLPQDAIDTALDPLIRRLRPLYDAGRLDRRSPDFWAARAAADLAPGAGRYDRGLVSIYLLNLLKLEPWEATFIPAGVLHAYLEGVAVEIMASSDNVLRGGLTPKHVDVPELLRVVTFEPRSPITVRADAAASTEQVYRPPVEEFGLARLTLAAGRSWSGKPASGADTLLVLEGQATLLSAGHSMRLGRGDAVLVPSGVAYRVEGSTGATLVRAFVPEG